MYLTSSGEKRQKDRKGRVQSEVGKIWDYIASRPPLSKIDLAKIDLGTVCIQGKELPIEGVVHKQAKRLKLYLDPRQRRIRLTIPKKVSLKAARQFVLDSDKWLDCRLNQLAKPVPFTHGQTLPIFGRSFQLHYREHKLAHICLQDNNLWVQGEKEKIHALVVGFLKNHSEAFFFEKSQAYASQIGAGFKRIRVTETYSRWGSCSPSGTLSYSWRLVFAPLEVAEYVIAHEVCHLKEMNHGPGFWVHVASLCADFRQHRAWLKTHGRSLFSYGEEPAMKGSEI